MALAVIDIAEPQLPPEWAAVPVVEQQMAAPIRICVIVQRQLDPPQLLLLRQTDDAQVFLGCICDAGGHVSEWIELWVQTLPQHNFRAPLLPMLQQAPVDNSSLQQRWRERLQRDRQLQGRRLVETGWEQQAPAATFIDPVSLRPVHPCGPNGQLLVLCQDDALLAQHKLPLFSSTSHRYLHEDRSPAGSPFYPATAGAPTNGATEPLQHGFGARAAINSLLPLNPSAGPMAVRRFSPTGFEDLLAMLNGQSAEAVKHGPVGFSPTWKFDGASCGPLLLDRHNRSARLVEVFHLKLRLLLQVAEQVQSQLRLTQRPLLNLRPESFQIDACGDGGHGLPWLWMFQPALVDGGDATALQLPDLPEPYFIPTSRPRLSIYQPSRVHQRISGRGQFQIRRLLSSAPQALAVEGSLHTREHLVANKGDLLGLVLHLPQGVQLLAQMEQQDNFETGEIIVRTAPMSVSESAASALSTAEGVLLSDVPFVLLPRLSSPCDLYSVGVLAAQVLLSGGGRTLAEAVADVSALARHVAREHHADAPLHLRVQSALGRDARLQDGLGVHRVDAYPTSSEPAPAALPEELWHEALGIMIRMFPGYGPDSVAADLGDAPAGAIDQVFTPVVAALRSLAMRSRSLLLGDWRSNSEMHVLINQLRAGLPNMID